MFWMQWYLRPGVGGLLIWSRASDCGCRDKTQDPPGTRRLAKARQVSVRVPGKCAEVHGSSSPAVLTGPVQLE